MKGHTVRWLRSLTERTFAKFQVFPETLIYGNDISCLYETFQLPPIWKERWNPNLIENIGCQAKIVLLSHKDDSSSDSVVLTKNRLRLYHRPAPTEIIHFGE